MSAHHLSKTQTIKVILYIILFLVILYLLYYLLNKLPASVPIPTPTSRPTPTPTSRPTSIPTIIPTSQPTSIPTIIPTSQPTSIPTIIPTPTPFVDSTPSPTVPVVNNFLGVWKYNTTYSYVFDSGYRWFFYNGSTLLNYGTYQLVGSTICNITITNQMNTNDSEEWGVPKRMSCLYQSSPKTITNTYILQTLTYDSITNPYPTPVSPTEPPSGIPTLPPVPTTVPPTPPLTPPPVIIATPPPSSPSGIKPDGVSCYDGHDGPSCNDLVCLNGGTIIYSNPTINDTGPYCSCLGNYDPSTNCAVCSGNYDPATNCLTCINTNFDFNFNCTQCVSGRSGKNCSAVNCGTGTAIVTDITSTNGTCSCPAGFDPAYNCSQCLPGRSGKNCSVINCGNGTEIITDIISTNGTCSCIGNFNPSTNCSTCLSGYGGPNCMTTCANGGTANTNPAASTVCSCTGNFNSATNCSTCLSGYGGPNCTTTCTNGGTANTNPNASTVCSCTGNFNPATNCNSINCINGTLSSNGLTCNCATGWTNDSNGICTLCAPGYAGPNCTSNYCGTNGTMPTVATSPNSVSACVCTLPWSNNPTTGQCTWCAAGYAGPNCTSEYCGYGRSFEGSLLEGNKSIGNIKIVTTVPTDPNGQSCPCAPNIIPNYNLSSYVCVNSLNCAPGFTLDTSVNKCFSNACSASFSTTAPCTGKCWPGYAINPNTGKCEWCDGGFNGFNIGNRICYPDSFIGCGYTTYGEGGGNAGYSKNYPHPVTDSCFCNPPYKSYPAGSSELKCST